MIRGKLTGTISTIHCKTGIVYGIFDLQGCFEGEDSRMSKWRGGADDGNALREDAVTDSGVAASENMRRMKDLKR